MIKVLKVVLIVVLALNLVISGNILAAEAGMSPASTTTPTTTSPAGSTHTTNPATTEVSIKIVWDDLEDQNHDRPGSVKAILSNGMEITLNEWNNWAAIVGGLPQYDNNGQIQYSWTITMLPEDYAVKSITQAGTMFTVTIGYLSRQIQETIRIVWEDGENQLGKRPLEMELSLSNGSTIRLDQYNGWSATVLNKSPDNYIAPVIHTLASEDLPKGYVLADTYRIESVVTYILENSEYKAKTLAGEILKEIGYDLKAAYQWSVDLEYEKVFTGETVYTSAIYGFENHKGDCFAKACTFCAMARVLGYECNVIYGSVPYAGGGYGDHAWCEILYENEILVCDPDFESDTDIDGYLIRYGQSGTWKYVYGGIIND